MNSRINSFLQISLLLLLFFIATPSFALTKGFQAISLYPATDGGPYIGIWGSENFNRWQFELGTMGVYAYRPFQLTVNGSRSQGILDNTFIQHFYSQIGIVDRWLSVGFDLPMGWWADFRDPNVAGSTNQNKIVVGDAYINIKSELVQTRHLGLAFRPFITIPTGYGREFFGNGNVTGGGTLIAEVKPYDIWSVSLNAGVLGREEFDFRNMKKDTQLELGLGTSVQVTKPVSIVAEIATSTRFMDPFAEKVETPTEARGAVKWKIGKTGFLASAGGTAGIIRNSGAPTYSIFAGISFSPKRHERKMKRAQINYSEYTVYFPVNSHSLNDSKDSGKICDLSDRIRDNNTKIKVAGYADSTGSKAYNETLSKKRAEKVAWWLELLGIDRKRMTISGAGISDPAGDNKTAEGRAKNRRVEFSE